MQAMEWVQIQFSFSRTSLTSCTCSSQQLRPLQMYTSVCTEQHHAVRGDLPGTLSLLFLFLQYEHRIWTALISPRCNPAAVRLLPSRIMWHWSWSICSCSWNRSFLPLESIWGNKTWTNFQKRDSSSPSSRHLGISFLQAKNESTNVTPKISSWMRVCQRLVFQIFGKCKMPCLNWLCRST